MTKRSSAKANIVDNYNDHFQVALISNLFYYNSMENIDTHIRRLWLTYKAYYMASVRDKSIEPSDLATKATKDYMDYLAEQINNNGYNWDPIGAIENQIRILVGFVECYDRPVKRDKFTNKTRWSL